MSAASTMFDTMRARVQAVLPNHHWLKDPYNLDENSDLDLNQGAGMAIGPALNGNAALCSRIEIDRSMTVAITRKFFATEMNIDAKEAVEKQLLEDEVLVVSELLRDPTGLIMNAVAKINFVGDSGIERVFGEKFAFLTIKAEFNLRYEQDLI